MPETQKVQRQISVTLSEDENSRLENYRWENRIDKKSDIVKRALTEYLDRVAPIASDTAKGK